MTWDAGRVRLLLQQGRMDLAESELRQRLTHAPDDGWALALLALCALHREKPIEARRTAEAAVAADPELATAHYALGLAVASDAYCPELNRRAWWKYEPNPDGPRVRRAMEHVREAIRLDPSNPGSYEMLARLEMQLGRLPDAQDTVERGLRLDPDDASCNALLVELLEMQGKSAQAELVSRRALGSNPDDADTQQMRGWALLRQGRPDEAAESFAESLRLHPGSESSRFGLLEASRASHAWLRWMPRASRWAESLWYRKALVAKSVAVAVPAGAALFWLGVYAVGWLPVPQAGQGWGAVVFAGAAFGFACVMGAPLALIFIGKLLNLTIYFDPRGRAALLPAERVWALLLPPLVLWWLAAWFIGQTAGGATWAGALHTGSAFAIAPVSCAAAAIPARRRGAWAMAAAGIAGGVGLTLGLTAGWVPFGYGWSFLALFWSVAPVLWAGRPLEAGWSR
ncbi:MAG: tetratricopeptide repeat protein [Planctomycetota bacterium]